MRKGSLETNNKTNKNVKLKKNQNKVTQKDLIKMFVWLAICIFVISQVFSLVSYTLGKKDKSKMWLYNIVNSITYNFKNKVDSLGQKEEYSVKFAGLGDIYFNANTLKGAKSSSGYNFTSGMESVKEKLKDYDIVVASLNTPIADSSLGLSTKDTYNSPVQLIDSLKELNISAVATATSHIFDKSSKGITSTIKNLEENDIKQVGISDETRNTPIILTKNNISIGLLSYTTFSQVKLSDKNSYMLNVFDEESLKSDIDYLKSNNVDVIVSYLNVPNENNTMVNSKQKKTTEKLFEAGVNVVLGTGSMVVQESTEELTENSHLYAIYSLGDFIGTALNEDNALSVIANIEFKKEITKDKSGNVKKTKLDIEVGKPIGIWTTFDNKYSRKMYLLKDEITNYNSNKSNVSAKEYKKMQKANDRIDTIFAK